VRRLAALLALAVAARGAGGCGGDGDGDRGDVSTGATIPAELARRTLVSTAIDGRRLVDGTQVMLRFGGETLAASAGCNTIVGGYELAGGRLRWSSGPSTTEIGCEAPLHAQDDWLSGLLDGEGAAATIAGDTLVLARDGVQLTLREGRRGHPPLPVVGTYWTLETIADAGPDGSAASVPAGARAPTLRFTEDDRVVLFAGCNTGGGRAVVRDDGSAEIGPLTLTRIACGEAATELERTVTSILEGRVSLESRPGGSLVVSKAGRQLVFRPG